ncbi:MAG: apolipoprotein N-acyltransferase [Magnetococcales bacterium]|nr:apolipoprotein N-acyltransferase [Magnetococcales bacterium]NGZ07425.1 apolipoprotein N-acyltransferase [Magnetococcales bacterium]
MRFDQTWIRLRAWLQQPVTRQAGVAFLAGAMAMWGLPPDPNPVWTVLGLAIWLRLLDGQSARQGAWLGFFFGWGHFLPGLAWLWTSLHEFGKIPSVVVVVMIVGLAAILALYPALSGAVLARFVVRRALLPWAAPPVWVVTEWLRAHLFSGFPWNLLGYVWDNGGPILQTADLGGVYLLSGLTLFLAGLLSRLLRIDPWRQWQQVVVLVVIGMGCLALASGYGVWRQQEIREQLARSEAPTLRVAMVQGNIGQAVKWDPQRQSDWLNRYLDLSSSLDQPVDLVVWPETAAAFFLQYSPKNLDLILELTRSLHIPVLTGAPMADRDDRNEFRYFNSMVLIGPDEIGELRHRYDKHHLVPFGEYMPFRALLPDSVQKLTHGAKDFSSGPGPALLPTDLGAFGPLICYEVIFPDEVRQLATLGARWLVNLTNDGWFGESAKPQHLAMARMRAVENRLSMIRVANSGISASFDPLGRELARIPSNVMAAIVVEVPSGIGHTIWSRYGHLGIGLWSGWALGIVGIGYVQRRSDVTLYENNHIDFRMDLA